MKRLYHSSEGDCELSAQKPVFETMPRKKIVFPRLTKLLCCSLLSVLGLGAGFSDQSLAEERIRLPDIGNPSGNLLSPTDEQRLGRAFMRSVRNSMSVIQDPLLSDYIQSLGREVVRGNENASGEFTFFMINAPQINAFAGPGGHIGVYTGLITTTESESELASVIAHEVAHVTQQHLVRTYDAVQSMSLPAAAVAIAGILIGAATDNPEVAVAATTGVQAGMMQREINFTRSHEEEADSIGIQTLAAAGFDPTAMPVFFSRMGKATRLYDNGKLPEFLRTHPVTTNRIADAYGRARTFPYKQRVDSLGYHLIRERLRVLAFKAPSEGVTFYRRTLEEGRYRNRAAAQYGFLLALIATRAYTEAEVIAQSLMADKPQQVEYIAALAELQKQSGNPDQAIETLKQGLQHHPANYPLSIYYAQALLDSGQPKAVIPLLEQQLEMRSDEVLLYKLLAQAAGDHGNKSAGHNYLAEYHYRTGDLKTAIIHLETALKISGLSYYESARLAARLKELKQEKKELEAREG